MNNYNNAVDMVIGEYLIKCPHCLTEIKMVSEMLSPIMVYCKGCDRTIVMHNNTIFTLPFEFVYNLVKTHKVRTCGNIMTTTISKNAKQVINKDKIEDLQQLLSQPLDVQDFLKKIDE